MEQLVDNGEVVVDNGGRDEASSLTRVLARHLGARQKVGWEVAGGNAKSCLGEDLPCL
jgi:hypothetical protein